MHSPRFYLSAGLTAVMAVLLAAPNLAAQNGQNFQKIHFETADGVDIQGFWYPSVRNAPVVMILHDLGQDSSRKEWNDMANVLQKAGYAVLAFDFRGHGNSTAVNPQVFQPLNPGIKVQAGGVINVKTFPPNYIPMFVNDITAAKAFLDVKNDQGDCNSSSLILMGAGQGATLGAIWLNSEWLRFPVLKFGAGVFTRKQANFKAPCGKQTVAAIWLSMSHKVGNTAITKRIPRMLKRAANHGTPMVFTYNSANKNDKTLATFWEKSIKSKNLGKKQQFIGKAPVALGKNLKGRELLLKPGKMKEFVGWLDGLKNNAKFNNWVMQNFGQSEYWWWLGNRPVPATYGNGDTSFQFLSSGTVARFIP